MIKMSCGGPQDLKDRNIDIPGAEVYDFRFSAVTKGS